MAMKYLGESFDIHCGGEEHIFPHHENEIAQSEAVTGKPSAKYWLHVRHLLLDGRKMSKSIGEFVPVQDAVERYGALSVRIFLLSTHYRKNMSLDQDIFQSASNHTDKLGALWATIQHFSIRGQASPQTGEDRLLGQMEQSKLMFEEAMSRDLSTPLALSAILRLARETAGHLDTHGSISKDTAFLIHAFLKTAGTVLLGDLVASELEQSHDEALKDLVEFVVEQRDKLRLQQRYDDADLVRKRLEQLGIVLQDLSGSTIWRRARREVEKYSQ